MTVVLVRSYSRNSGNIWLGQANASFNYDFGHRKIGLRRRNRWKAFYFWPLLYCFKRFELWYWLWSKYLWFWRWCFDFYSTQTTYRYLNNAISIVYLIQSRKCIFTALAKVPISTKWFFFVQKHKRDSIIKRCFSHCFFINWFLKKVVDLLLTYQQPSRLDQLTFTVLFASFHIWHFFNHTLL